MDLYDLHLLIHESNPPAHAAYQTLRSRIYVQSSNKILAAVFERVTERIYGQTFALRNLPAYQHRIPGGAIVSMAALQQFRGLQRP